MGKRRQPGFTKQGVRDLSHLQGKSTGRKLEAPPVPIDCKHKNRRELSFGWFWVCEDCGASGDYGS